MTSARISFTGSLGETLAARLDMPRGTPRAYALFAHCFSCSKDILAASRISGQLADDGIAVLRFDFTGLGNSDGDFSNTNFSSNVDDLLAAVNFLRKEYEAPSLMIGHSLGGSAVLMAATDVPECKAVVTLGAPANPEHVTHNFAEHLDEIEKTGLAEVQLGGRPFTIRKQFVDDLSANKVLEETAILNRALLVMHAPGDNQVSIENATEIFTAAPHPKSFISLDDADHLLTNKDDATYAAGVICSWAERYIAPGEDLDEASEPKTVIVQETGNGFWESVANASGHELIGDQPKPVGGGNGPGPYDFVAMGLGLCTNQTLRMYARHKRLPPVKISSTVRYEKVHAEDVEGHVKGDDEKVLTFFLDIELEGELEPAVRQRMLEISEKCPVHKALRGNTAIQSKLIG